MKSVLAKRYVRWHWWVYTITGCIMTVTGVHVFLVIWFKQGPVQYYIFGLVMTLYGLVILNHAALVRGQREIKKSINDLREKIDELKEKK